MSAKNSDSNPSDQGIPARHSTDNVDCHHVDQRDEPRQDGRVTENSEYFAFLSRIVRAGGRRVVETGDVDSLTHLAAIGRELDAIVGQVVYALRADSPPYSDAEIAARLGVSRQAVRQRWPHRKGSPADVDQTAPEA